VLFVIKYFTKYTLCCRTHLTTLSHLLAVGGVTLSFTTCITGYLSCRKSIDSFDCRTDIAELFCSSVCTATQFWEIHPELNQNTSNKKKCSTTNCKWPVYMACWFHWADRSRRGVSD